MSVILTRGEIWPTVRNIYIFNPNTSHQLFIRGLVEEAPESFGEGAIYIIIHEWKYYLPKTATSRLALYFIGFNTETIELIWAWVHNPRSASGVPPTDMPNKATEFWNRVGFWVTNTIQNVMKTMYLIPNTSAHELLDCIGMRQDAQDQKYTFNGPAEQGGLQTFSLADVDPSIALFWAGRVILRRWNMLVAFESTVWCSETNEFDESGWTEVMNEFLQSPIDAGMPYSSDPAFLLPGEKLVLRISTQKFRRFGQLPDIDSNYRFDPSHKF